MIKRIVLVPHTHTDIGYTGLRTAVASQHLRHLGRAIELCEREPDYRWAIEASWTLELFLRHAPARDVERLRTQVRQGRIEITGFYVQPLTQLCGLDELDANFAVTAELAAEVGSPPIQAAVLDDIGGLSASLPQLLRFHGLHFLVNGCGGWRSMVPFTSLPHLFRLTGPDRSSVLCYHLGDDARNRQPGGGPAQYGFGIIYFLWPMLKDPVERRGLAPGELPLYDLRGREGIDLLCHRLERDGYPYDTVLLQTATDNAGPYERVPEMVREWNCRYATPEVSIGTFGGFCQDLEARYGRQIPSIQGELTCSWTEHAITAARATGRYRDTRRRLADWAATEALAGRATAGGARTWQDAIRHLLLYSDHTCGLSMWLWEERVKSAGSLWHDSLDMARESWETKRGYVEQALALVRAAEEDQALACRGEDRDQPSLVTLANPHSFPFSGRIQFATKQPRIELVDGAGRVTPADSQQVNTEWYRHSVEVTRLPGLSCRSFQVRPAAAPPELRYRAEGWTLRGPGSRVEISPATGGVVSVSSGQPPQEWVQTGSPGLNEVLWFKVDGVAALPVWGGLGEPGVRFTRLPLCVARRLGAGSGHNHAWLFVRRRFRTGGRQMDVDTQYTLDASGLRLRNTIRKVHGPEKEACFFAFPFALKRRFRIDVEQQGSLTHFPDERLPGSTTHDLGVQDFVSLADETSQVVLTSLQACLLSFQAPVYFNYGLDFPRTEVPTVYSYAFNNLWNTNCPILQEGELGFEYHVAFRQHRFMPGAAFHASRAAARPALAFLGPWGVPDAAPEAPPLLDLDTDAVMVDSFRPRGPGLWEVRLVETCRRQVRCGVRLNPARFAEFAVGDRALPPTAWKPIPDKPVSLAFRPAQFRCLWLRQQPDR